MDVLTLRNLHKAFGRQKVLQGIDLTVPQHSIFGFIGKNGAGKTTTMKTILGLEKADAGELYIMQEPVVFGNTRTNRYIGYVSDVPEFYGFMTAREYLQLCAEISGLAAQKAKTRIDELLQLVGLSETGKKRCATFSRGMKQRLAIAQGLLNEPKLLIGQMMEKVVLAPQRPRKTDAEIAEECKDWATCGKGARKDRNIITSLELKSEVMEKINQRLQAKYKAMEENEVRYEAIDCDDADYVIVAFGSSARICSATVEMARAEGIKVGLLRPITLYPFPTKAIADLAKRGVKGFLSAELNAGQMVQDVKLAVNGAAPVEHYGRQGGMMFSPDEVLVALKEKLINKK